jgi:hypothetical protein
MQFRRIVLALESTGQNIREHGYAMPVVEKAID